MTDTSVVDAALGAAGLPARRTAPVVLSLGATGSVVRLELLDGSECVAKLLPPAQRAALQAELDGLVALAATETVRVPHVRGLVATGDAAALFVEHLRSASVAEPDWTRAGRALARLHEAPSAGRYGFPEDGFLGAAPQRNAWSDDWVEFMRDRRLGALLDAGRRAGTIDRALGAAVDRLLPRLGEILPARPTPALLHGDLWSGNLVPCRGLDRPEIALIDPACFTGDRWYEFGIMDLFGGVPPALHRGYAEAACEPAPNDDRGLVYRLHHLLNHLNLFGSGYREACASVLARLPAG